MKVKRNTIMMLMIVATLILSSCGLIDLDVKNDLTKVLSEQNISYKNFSEYAQNEIYNIVPEHFCEYHTADFSEWSEGISGIREIIEMATTNKNEVNAVTNAMIEDIMISYGISKVNANAFAVQYAVEQYSNECALKNKVIKEGVYIKKISSKTNDKEVKFNGKATDMALYVNKYINEEARGGYYSIEISEYGVPLTCMWAEKRGDVKRTDEFTSYMTYDYADIENGTAPVGVYPVTINMSNMKSSRVISRTSIAKSVNPSSYIDSDVDNSTLCDIFKRDINDKLNSVYEVAENSSSDNQTSSESADVTNHTFISDNMLSDANSKAKLAFTNAATYCVNCEVNGKPVGAGWYIVDLSVYPSGSEYSSDGTDMERALCSLMGGNKDSGYVAVKISDTCAPLVAYWSDCDVFDYVDLESLYEKDVLTVKNYLIGGYPEESIKGEDENFNVSSTKVFNRLAGLDGSNESVVLSDSTELTSVVSSNTTDPFVGLKIEYDGASPYLTASLNTSDCADNVRRYVNFSIEGEQFRIGDPITVKAEWTEGDFPPVERTFTVENAAYYLDDVSSVDLSELDQLMFDFVESEASKGINGDYLFGVSLGHGWFDSGPTEWTEWSDNEVHQPYLDNINTITKKKVYFCSIKQSRTLNEDKIYNKYCIIYNVNFSAHDYNKEIYGNVNAKIAVFMDNIVCDNGEIKYNSTEPLDSRLLYYKAENTIPIIEANYITALKGVYNVKEIALKSEAIKTSANNSQTPNTIDSKVQYVKVSESSANIRSSANKNISSNIIGTAKKGTRFKVISYDGYWYNIEYNGGSAYISHKMVDVE